MECHINTSVSLLCGLVVLLVMAAVGRAEQEIVVRELRATEEFDHQLCKRLAGLASLPRSHAVWPRLWDSPEEYRRHETIVALVEGLIAGRAVLEAPYHPYCELVNLCVRPDCRGRGVATALVRESIRRAREMGFKYMVLQEDKDAPEAHGIYEEAGFLPATVGEMQRLIHLLDVPLVSVFLTEHPDAAFVSEAADDIGERWWRLRWQAGDEYVALCLHGGSCQFDSEGFQPVVQACEFARGDMALVARVEVDREVWRGGVPPDEMGAGGYARPRDPAELAVTVENRGAEPFRGVVRAVLLPDTEVVGDDASAAPQVEVEPGEAHTVRLPIRVRHQFRCDGQRLVSYPSAPFTAELCWEGGSVLLSAAAKVR